MLRKIAIILALMLPLSLAIPSTASAQNQITIPKEKPKSKPNTNNGGNSGKGNSGKGNSGKGSSNKGKARQEDSYTPPPVTKHERSFPTYEQINGMDVYWSSEVNEEQHSVISNLIENMVYVAGGSFQMGDNSTPHTRPVHKVNVNSFHIGKYEVTQNEWNVVMGGRKHISNNNRGGRYPVEYVTLYECQEFVSRLNNLTGLHFRIPTEHEWEYAARGGQNSRGYTYSGSNTATSVGWIKENSGGDTHPVGMLSPNELGIYDMTGNVNEWICERNSETYDSSRNSKQYVLRGGNYYWKSDQCANTSRYQSYPEDAWPDTGLRLAH